MTVALTVALAIASTNFDNLAILLGLVPRLGLWRALPAFALSLSLVVAAAVAVGNAAEWLPAQWLGLLGLVPLGLGLRGLWQMLRHRSRAEQDPGVTGEAGFGTVTLTFLAMSADTFALTAALLADSSERVDPHILGGAVLGVAALVLTGLVASRAVARVKPVVERLDRVAPFVMIASGIYILADTLTDVV